MKIFRYFIATIFLIMNTSSNSDELGKIGQLKEDGLPVVYKFVDELPTEKFREEYSWLTVISWKYDGKQCNGMPMQEVNNRMITLEHELETLENDEICRHVYSRTGKNLKELVYYIKNRTKFMDAFNHALNEHLSYPIEINFYKDPTWRDFQKILEIFRSAE